MKDKKGFACSYMLIWMYENGVNIVLIVEAPLYINEPWRIDKSLLEYSMHPESEE